MSGEDLCKYYLKCAYENRPIDETFIRYGNATMYAMIIEPRFDDVTEHVIYNFMHFLNPLGWNLIIISYSGNHQMIQEKYPHAFVCDIGDKHIYFDDSGSPNISIDSYNTILLDVEMWRQLPGETIIVFQRDCIMFREFPKHFTLYDYAGANFYEINQSPLFGGMNGGFSIRKREAMIECLERVSWDDIFQYRTKMASSSENEHLLKNEDVFFTHACEILRKVVPDMYSRTFLCLETDFNPDASVIHGWNKEYTTYENLTVLLKASPLFSTINPPSKICFITAIYGNYELSCKPFAPQTENTDFICFTDNPNIARNGWKIDTYPYHIHCKNELDDGAVVNSIKNNKHTFNIAKYYKQSFRLIPALKRYDVVVWIDGSIEITCDKTSEYILNRIYDKKIIGWHHERRGGILKNEVDASSEFYRYISTFWNGQSQPIQNVDFQYQRYLEDGYSESFFRELRPENPHFGVWLTCFVAFLMTDPEVVKFLDLWYSQTLKYTTQDQVGFPYVCQKTNLIPYTLPDEEVRGEFPHQMTDFYIKHEHGK